MTRQERTELKWQKRIALTHGRSLSSFRTWRPWASIFIGWESFRVSTYFLWTAFKEYLSMQFLVKWRILKIPVRHVDHALDKKVPFVPEKLPVYMTFVAFWLQPLSMLMYRNGFLRALPTYIDYIRHIRTAYHEAGRFYHFSMSTTCRPPAKGNKGFRMIHIWDPHYLCVPSLHVIIVVLCFSYFRRKFAEPELRIAKDEREQWNAELYHGAAEIVETVLYVKQHSVNCIPAAIYMMTRVYPQLITPEIAVAFIDELFKDADDIAPEDRRAVVEHIQLTYEKFLLEGAQEDDWREPVMRWIEQYQADK